MLFRSWYRIRAYEYWNNIRVEWPLRISHEEERFIVDITPDWEKDQEGDEDVDLPLFIVKGYQYSEPSPDVWAILTGESGPEIEEMFQSSKSGLEHYPNEYSSFLNELAARIDRLTSKVLATLSWRAMTPSAPPEFRQEAWRLFWASPIPQTKLDDLSWRQVPSGIMTVDLPPMTTLLVNDEVRKDVEIALSESKHAPLGHDLYREAWRIRYTNRRASFVIAVAAVETGLKECIGILAPDAAWLAREAPTPPVHKIFRDYLPTLHSKAMDQDTVPPVASGLMRVLRESIEKRNAIVHGRREDVSEEELDALLTTGYNLLYQLDYHCGELWATGTRSQKPELQYAEIDNLGRDSEP